MSHIITHCFLHVLQATNTTEKSPQPGPSSRPDVLPEVKSFKCRRCTQCFTNRRELYLHGMQHHFQTGGRALQERPWEIDQAPWETEEDPRLKQVYEANEPLILDNHQESSAVNRQSSRVFRG